MDYATLDALRRTHPAWRLLSTEHAPLVVSFLHHSFIRGNVRTLSEPELASLLDDHLFHLRERYGQSAFPRTARQYLETWSNDAHGWLRRYYPPEGDEASFDLAPTTERAIDWLVSLRQREFVGTESKLMTVFELLRQITEGTELNPDVRITELEKRRAQIDEEIARLGAHDDSSFVTACRKCYARKNALDVGTLRRGLLCDR